MPVTPIIHICVSEGRPRKCAVFAVNWFAEGIKSPFLLRVPGHPFDQNIKYATG